MMVDSGSGHLEGCEQFEPMIELLAYVKDE